MPTIRTFYADLERARAAWIGDDTLNAVEREEREKSSFLARVDESGRCVDLHAMRMTLGTALPRAGVVPQVAMWIMRHADMRTTLHYYTDLRLHDLSNAIGSVPHIPGMTSERERQRATGTCAVAQDATKHSQRMPQQLGHNSLRNRATGCDSVREIRDARGSTQAVASATVSGGMRAGATRNETAGDATRTRNIQLGRLQHVHSN